MKHVLFIPGWYGNLRGKGGGTFFREQAAVLRTRGWEVRILYADLRPFYLPWARSRFDDDDSVPVLRYQCWAPPKLDRWTIRCWQQAYLRAFAQYRDRWGMPEIIHAHSYLGGLAAAAAKEKWGTPYVLTEHLGRISQGAEQLAPRIKLAIRLSYEAASGLYAVSNQLAKQMEYLSGRPIDGVLPNMLDTDFFTPSVSTKQASSTFTICSIGDPWYRKGLDLLIEAVGVAQLQTDRKLVLKLADEIPQRAKLVPIINKWKLAQQVVFMGKISKEKVRELLRSSDVCVSASRYESFGITMVEALACGTPVIATKTAGGEEIIQDGVNGYLVPIGSPRPIADALLRIVKRRKAFSSAALRIPIVEKYSYEAVARKLEAIYRTATP
jgi:glycosyltransferase involved in cell wall biosynthesis